MRRVCRCPPTDTGPSACAVGSEGVEEEEKGAQGTTDFILGIVFATMVGWASKLMAHILQQKAIGERLSGRVSVRQAVGVNSVI